MRQRRGGNGANSLEVLQQLLAVEPSINLGLNLCSVLPAEDSGASRQVRDSLRNVDCSSCVYRQGSTQPASSFIVRSQISGSRTSISHAPLEEMTLAEFKTVAATLGHDACWYHFEGRMPEITVECMRYLRLQSSPPKISVELENPRREGLLALSLEADVTFLSKTWAEHHGHRTALEMLQSHGGLMKRPATLFCAWGDAGAAAYDCGNRNATHVPAQKLEEGTVVE